MNKISESRINVEVDSMDKLMSVLNHRYIPEDSLINPNRMKMQPSYDDIRKNNFLVRPPTFTMTQPGIFPKNLNSDKKRKENTNTLLHTSNPNLEQLSERSNESLLVDNDSNLNSEKNLSPTKIELERQKITEHIENSKYDRQLNNKDESYKIRKK